MFRAATESSSILNDLRTRVDDESKWLNLAEAQPSPAAQIEILYRAVATVPASHELWTQLIQAKISNNDTNGLINVLHDALSLFPSDTALWQIMFNHYPSTEAYTTALRYINNAEVWPAYLNYLLNNNMLTPLERFEGCKHYLEYDNSSLPTLVRTLTEANHRDVAAELLLFCANNSSSTSSSTNSSTNSSASSSSISGGEDWAVWKPVVLHETANEQILEIALKRFTKQAEAPLVSLLMQQKLRSSGFNAARTLILHHLESPASVQSFCELFQLAIQLYEHEIEESMKNQGQGGWNTARVLTEYSNIIRKRPLLLSDAAIAESPNNVELWLDRADIWQHRPHIAADTIETALKKVDPLRPINGDYADLHIRYAELLVANGNEPRLAVSHLDSALSKDLNTRDAKAKLYMAIADVYQGAGQDPDAAVQVLETGIAAVPNHTKLWTHYISVLVESQSATLLEGFSRCCTHKMATMRIVLLVASAFEPGSSNQMAVFDKGVSMFPVPMVLPLWHRYIDSCKDHASLDQLREIFSRALNTFSGHKKGYEELVLQYAGVEMTREHGSMLLARKRLQHILAKSTSLSVWEAYIRTFGNDTAGKRRGFEEAIARLNDAEATTMALKMAEFEEQLGEVERARALLQYASQLQSASQLSAATSAWQEFDQRHRGPMTVDFVPAM